MNLIKQTSNLSLSLVTMILSLFCSSTNAQDMISYTEGKAAYRVIAVKEDTNRIESVSNTVELTKSTTVYFPNAFTPDRDGVNDTFGAVGLNTENYNLKIYNRWGELLFVSENITDKWDGTYNGEVAPEGVYVYSFYARESVSGKSISKTGTVTLLL